MYSKYMILGLFAAITLVVLGATPSNAATTTSSVTPYVTTLTLNGANAQVDQVRWGGGHRGGWGAWGGYSPYSYYGYGYSPSYYSWSYPYSYSYSYPYGSYYSYSPYWNSYSYNW